MKLRIDTISNKIIQAVVFLVVVSLVIKVFFPYDIFVVASLLTTMSIAAIPLSVRKKDGKGYRFYCSIALICSAVVDFCLRSYSPIGYLLLANVIAVIFFTIAFTRLYGFRWNIFALFPFLFSGMIFYVLLIPHLHQFNLASGLFTMSVIVMGWQGVALYNYNKTNFTRLILAATMMYFFNIAIRGYLLFYYHSTPLEYVSQVLCWGSLFLFAYSTLTPASQKNVAQLSIA